MVEEIKIMLQNSFDKRNTKKLKQKYAKRSEAFPGNSQSRLEGWSTFLLSCLDAKYDSNKKSDATILPGNENLPSVTLEADWKVDRLCLRISFVVRI